jgi:hypothetical protein
MGLEAGTWVVGLVGAFDRGMIEKEVNVMPGIDLGDQANLGCTSRPGSLCRVLVVSSIGSFMVLYAILGSLCLLYVMYRQE